MGRNHDNSTFGSQFPDLVSFSYDLDFILKGILIAEDRLEALYPGCIQKTCKTKSDNPTGHFIMGMDKITGYFFRIAHGDIIQDLEVFFLFLGFGGIGVCAYLHKT